MKRNLFLASALTIISLGFVGCSKDDDKPKNEITVANIAGTYKLTALEWKLPNGETEDVYAQLEDCNRDDLVQLKTDMTILFNDAGVVCDPPGDVSGSWELHGNHIVLGPVEGTITKFDGKTLVMVGEPYDEPGVEATTTLTRQ